MNRFEYIKAPSIAEALDMMDSTVPEAMVQKTDGSARVVKAGGTDLLDLIKEGILEPGRLIDLKNIPGLDKLSFDKEKGLQFGPMVTIADLEKSKEVKQHYPALYQAAAHAATPQIRNMATMGGNLMQRPRCWYFRSNGHHCRKKGGTTCFAQIGQNQFHSIFLTNVCPCVHPSSLATALVAYDGKVELTGPEGKRVLPLSEFFTPSNVDVTCENVATNQEIITNIMLPPVQDSTRAHYIKQGQRESYDWSMGDVAVVLQMDGKKCRDARIVFGAAAPIPLRRESAEEVLKGKSINEKVIEQAAEKALEGATPLAYNGYKVHLFKTLLKRTIMEAAS
ncbi:MAG: xanthine dehydrogenase family protein subunit M [Phaeodactylibacter sp.]|nr:xanthine dehydrogenase family protein subunit M [Phaeodactylibacter sp.]MCB9267527.1 xanthine dehydrogenase family protein subunit M [Lewinellaceae bacterium]MCB9288119.1 xanthine dehydrogenase family protein subunit M [Lewinellaceae bacterium]